LRLGRAVDAHDILVAAAEQAAALDPARAVVMFAEAADAALFGARPEAMLHAASARGMRCRRTPESESDSSRRSRSAWP